MLECPSCRQRVMHRGQDNWFECPNCRNWIRLRVDRTGSTWLELGVFRGNVIQPVQFSPTQSQPASLSPASTNIPKRPIPDQMDMNALRTQQRLVREQLRKLEHNIERVIGLRSQNRQDDQLTRRYNTELSQYTQEQNDLKQYELQLIERESTLLEQEAQSTGATGGNGCAVVMVSGTILMGAGLLIFSRMIGLHVDFRIFLMIALISTVSGVLTWVIAQFN